MMQDLLTPLLATAKRASVSVDSDIALLDTLPRTHAIRSISEASRLFKPHITQITYCWLSTLSKHGYNMHQILRSVRAWCLLYKRNRVVCTTATPMTTAQKASLAERLSAKYSDAEIVYESCPEILGGIQITLPHRQMIDCTVRTKLHALQRSILEERNTV